MASWKLTPLSLPSSFQAIAMNRYILLTTLTSCFVINTASRADTCQEIDQKIEKLSEAEQLVMGKELFKRDWSTYKHEKGDGLGPFF
jgi:hypothetical protein